MPSVPETPPDTLSAHALRGKRVLITRARTQASELVSRLLELGAVPVVLPAIQITPPTDHYAALDAALQQLSSFDWAVFTSVNGVAHVWQRFAALGIAPEAWQTIRLAAVGPATAAALRTRGVLPAVVPDEHVAEALLAALPQPAGQRFLLALAELARDTLRTGLQAAGAEVVAVPVYNTVLAPLTPEALAELEAGVDIITFTASSTVRNFVELVGPQRALGLVAQARVVTIGPITAATVQELGLRVDVVATEYTIAGLLQALATVA